MDADLPGLSVHRVDDRDGIQPYRHGALSTRAKMLMMVQALLSLVTMVVVAARAVGELGP